MSMTLYFAKLNLVSDNIFELYDNPNQRNAISRALYEAINANKIWEKENLFIDANGEQRSTITEYSTHILRVDDTYSYIEGWLYKKSKLYYKTLNSMTNTLVQQSTENTEGNRFALDLKHGFVGYNTSARFGYKEFIEAFENIINLGEIKELKIRMQAPNPSDELLDDLQRRCDGLVKEFKDANVTELEFFYSTKGASGIDLTAPLIDEKINDIQGLHSGLPVEESTKKGYVSVEATSTTGRKYTSGDSKPIKRIINGIEDFFDSCIEAFRQL